MVRRSLVDEAANVRSAAARAFDMLQEALGVKAIDETIPTLLAALRQPGESSGTALQALREVMNVSNFQHARLQSATLKRTLGPGRGGLPNSHSNTYLHAHHRIQCKGIGFFGHRRRKCIEQTIKYHFRSIGSCHRVRTR